MRLGATLLCASVVVVSVLTVLLASSQVWAWRGTFNPDRVHVVDYYKRADGQLNIIFRGNEPSLDNNGTYSFAWDPLVTRMKEVLAETENLDFPQNFQVIDVNLLNPTEFKDEAEERKFFEKNPSLGRYMNWPIFGDLVNPLKLAVPLAADMARELNVWQLDRLPSRLPELRAMLQAESTGPAQIFYVHCEAGLDRTGEVCGSYYMQYKGMTLQQALDLDVSYAKRELRFMSVHGLSWYCLYLKYKVGFDQLTCDLQ